MPDCGSHKMLCRRGGIIRFGNQGRLLFFRGFVRKYLIIISISFCSDIAFLRFRAIFLQFKSRFHPLSRGIYCIFSSAFYVCFVLLWFLGSATARLGGFLYFHVITSRGTLILDLFFTCPSHARACVITMISSKLHLRLRTRKKNTEYVFWQENKNAQGWVRNQNKNEREDEE